MAGPRRWVAGPVTVAPQQERKSFDRLFLDGVQRWNQRMFHIVTHKFTVEAKAASCTKESVTHKEPLYIQRWEQNADDRAH